MRKDLLLTVVLLCAFNLIATCQESFQVTVQSSNFSSSQLKKDNRNGFYYFLLTSSARNSFIINHIENNKVQWSKIYTPDSISVPLGQHPGASTYVTNDNGVLITLSNSSVDSNIIYVFKCDSVGNVVWKLKVDKSKDKRSNGFEEQFCEAKDGSVYLVILNRLSYYEIIKFNKEGTLVWTKRIKYVNSNISDIGYITAAPDNGLLVAMNHSACESYCTGTDYQRFDAEGNKLWNCYLYDDRLGSNSTFFAAYEGNNLKLFSGIALNDLETYRYMIITLSDEKKFLNADVIDNDFFSLKYYLKQHHADYAKEFNTNNFLGSNWVINDDWSLIHNYISFPHTLKIDKYNVANEICSDSVKLVFSKKSESVKLKLYDLERDFLPAKLNFKPTNISVRNYKISYEVLCSSSTAVNSTVPNKLISDVAEVALSPNPTSNVLNINGLKANNNISVVSMNGKVLQEHNTATNSYRLNINNLKAGMYLLKINDGKQIQVKKFIKN